MRDGLNRVEDDYRSDREYGSPALAGLILAAFFLSLLPIPLVALQLLPTYSMHARFLIFYAPLVCFLVLGYLLYVREVLARIMFADVWEEVADPDPYYPESAIGRGRRVSGRIRTGVVNLLPALLLGTSLYCISRYVTRFNESVAMASGVITSRLPSSLPGDSAGVTPPGRAPDDTAGLDSVATPAETAMPTTPVESPEIEALRRLPGLATDPNPLRTYTLRMAMIDDIPYFAELTGLYIGGIACALAAVLLVLLKEYARSTLGLTEGEVLGGRLTEETLPDLDADAARRSGE